MIAVGLGVQLALASGIGLFGTIRDPQGLAVADARVELRCGAIRQTTVSGGDGAFSFAARPIAEPCLLTTDVRGFAAFARTVEPETRELVVLLQLATVREGVRVRVESRMEPHAPIGSLELLADALNRVSTNTEDWVAHAARLAGSPTTPRAVYVDGVPAAVLPPSTMVDRLQVNWQPFSAEYGDGDVTAINVITTAPARRFRLAPSGSGLAFGGSDARHPGLGSTSNAAGAMISGPLPRLPIGLVANLNVSSRATDLAFDGVIPAGRPGDAIAVPAGPTRETSHTRSLGLSGHYAPTPRVRAFVAYSGLEAEGTNAGVGGLVLPSAGFGSRSATHGLQSSVRVTRGRLVYEGGATLKASHARIHANSDLQGLAVSGYLVGGGSPVTRSASDRATMTMKQVVRGEAGHGWVLGVIASGTSIDQEQLPNPHGMVTFDSAEAYRRGLDGEATATWFVQAGRPDAAYAGWTIAPFAQATLWRTARFQVDGGVRVDRQAGVGAIASPRLWASSLWHGMKLQAGTGLFARQVPDATLLQAITSDGFHLRSFQASGVSLAEPGDASLQPLRQVRTAVSPELTAPRQWMHRLAVERPFGYVSTSLEYTHTRGEHLLGADRIRDGSDLLDVVAADRSSAGHRVHARIELSRAGQRIAAHYEWAHAANDTDGPFSHPARAGHVEGEWARAAGVPTHNATLTSTLTLPAAIFVTATATWQGASPYNITTGIDAEGLGLFTDRGGRSRNLGNGPSQQAVSLYASRRWALPRIAGRPKTGRQLDLGVQVDNLLGGANVGSVGSVAGSPTFGRLLGPSAGRAARLFVSVN